LPSSENTPCAIRFAYRPIDAPKKMGPLERWFATWLERSWPNDDVFPIPAAVRGAQHNDCGAIRADLRFQLFGFQREKIDFLAFRHPAKTLFAHVFRPIGGRRRSEETSRSHGG